MDTAADSGSVGVKYANGRGPWENAYNDNVMYMIKRESDAYLTSPKLESIRATHNF